MFIVKNRIIFFIVSAVFVVASIFAVMRFGMNFGIDFTGGSVLEVSYIDQGNGFTPSVETVKGLTSQAGFPQALVSPRGDRGFIIKTRDLSQEEKNSLIATLTERGTNPVIVEKFNSIGPVVGNELKQKAYVAIAVVVLCIVLFIMFAFRRLKNPLNYGLATIIALLHDVIVPTGVYVVYTHYTGAEIDVLFVSAILAILGYSVHDTIVVFDRVRENMLKHGNNKKSFEEIVGESVSQTFGRSINTSVTIFITLLALYLIGGSSTQPFAFVLLMGVIFGTYSSIFLASPLLVTLEGWRTKGK